MAPENNIKRHRAAQPVRHYDRGTAPAMIAGRRPARSERRHGVHRKPYLRRAAAGRIGKPRPDPTDKDIELFAIMSGDVNRTHVDEEFARSDVFHEVVAHGIADFGPARHAKLPGPLVRLGSCALALLPARHKLGVKP